MADKEPCELAPGDRVILASSGECGVIVHAWTSHRVGGQDCYVAFFGLKFPPTDEEPEELPHILRYAASSLRRAPV
jgi:hypothetical protein